MPRAVPRLGLLLLGALALAGCGQKGPLCLREPGPTAVPASPPAATADSSAPTPATVTTTTPGATSTTSPSHPQVPGYARCH